MQGLSMTSTTNELINDKFSISEASDYLNVSFDTIRRCEKKGLVKAHRNPTGHRLFSINEIAKLKTKLAGGAGSCYRILKTRKISDFSVIELFAGAGGLASGFENAGLKTKMLVEIDKNAAEELASISNESIDSLAESMFEAKSDLTGMSNRDILTVDSKIFEMGSKKVRVSVMETTNPQKVLELKENLEKEIAAMKSEEKLNYMFFFVIDILKSEATVLTTTPEESQIAQNAFHQSLNGELLVLPGVVSRKKQIIPSLEPVVASI